jgi:hypothetical protein
MALSASCLVVYVKKQQPARKEEVEIRNWLTSIYTGERERERERESENIHLHSTQQIFCNTLI